jgi:hypothetical protein
MRDSQFGIAELSILYSFLLQHFPRSIRGSKSKPTHIQNGSLLPRFTIGTHYFNIWLPDLGLVRLTEDYKVVEKKKGFGATALS